MRVSVTVLDSYRYWRENDYFTEEAERRSYEELVARIQGVRIPQSEDMLRGVAFHAICEDPVAFHVGDAYECGGFRFETVSANEVIMDLPADRTSEVKMEVEIGDVTLVGIADYMKGIGAGDVKLTKKVEPDKYADSIQWQAYLMMMDGRNFLYHCAKPNYRKKDDITRLSDYATFPFYRTRETDRRVTSLLAEFRAFALPILEASADEGTPGIDDLE